MGRAHENYGVRLFGETGDSMNLRSLVTAMKRALVPVALAEHGTVRDAALACGVTAATFRRWMRLCERRVPAHKVNGAFDERR